MKKALVSIITPTYNHERFIDSCIRSVLAQTFFDWEQIIIDDGSTDSTAERVMAYKDERIGYVRQENKGILKLASNYNRALELASGKYIAVLEGDDLWPEYKLERQLKLFDSEDIVLAWGLADVVDEFGNKHSLTGRRNVFKPAMLGTLLLSNPIPAVTVLIRKDALLSIGGFKQPPGLPTVDYPTWLHLATQGSFAFREEIYGLWRRHSSQATFSSNVVMAKGMNEFIRKFYFELTPRLKASLEIDSMRIELNNADRLASALFRKGRIELLTKNWYESRKAFGDCFRCGGTSSKVAAIIGIIFSHLHMDLEFIARLTGKDYIPSGRPE